MNHGTWDPMDNIREVKAYARQLYAALVQYEFYLYDDLGEYRK